MEIEALAKRLKSFNLEKAILQVVKDNANVAIDLNTDSQLFDKGIDSKGNLLPGPYAPFTIDIKGLKGQPTDRITLRDTRDFHDSFFIKANKFPVEIDATDSKTSELKSEWGDDIFGLTSDSLLELKSQILPDLQDKISKAIGVL